MPLLSLKFLYCGTQGNHNPHHVHTKFRLYIVTQMANPQLMPKTCIKNLCHQLHSDARGLARATALKSRASREAGFRRTALCFAGKSFQ